MIALSQKYRRELRDELQSNDSNLSIKLDVYQVANTTNGKMSGLDRKSGSLSKQEFFKLRIRTFHGSLKRGTYVIIPSTKNRGEASFFLRVAAQSFSFELSSMK